MKFSQYFTEKEIIRQLCRERVKLAGQRHDRMFLHNISSDRSPPSPEKPEHWGDNVPLTIFPPRRLWHRFRPPKANRVGSSSDINLSALLKATMTLRRKTPDAEWARNLKVVVDRIRSRAIKDANIQFKQPIIREEQKEPGSNFFRPLSAFFLEDKIIDRQTASYLRRKLEGLLCTSSLAFRCSTKHRRAPTIHDALDQIVTFQQQAVNRRLFAAECDIRGFFDCVPHSLALKSLNTLILEYNKLHADQIDSRAFQIFKAYLKAYSFLRNVKQKAEKVLKAKNPKAEFKWPKDDLRKLHGDRGLKRVGVPQGGALSCLIANAVLHSADKEIEGIAAGSGANLLYLRYCDDMILIADQENLCNDALSAYCNHVEKQCLLIHERKPAVYGKEFYSGKSHHPYPWGPGNSQIPWIQFVGFQIRHDGLVRVRLRSLKKQRRRMTEVADEVLATLNPGRKSPGKITELSAAVRRSAAQIEYRVEQRLISISVGRRQLGAALDEIMPMCWCNGFRGLRGRRIIGSSMKMLDRHRKRQIARIAKRLRSLSLPESKAKEDVDELPFYGLPFSYWGQFHPK